ncbi:MAG: DUF2520 domain-containing protein [Ignavibacteriales bacterium]|nr:DUF2520 domain-containing protein [Ignavibacteriales bacterium]
MASKLPKISIIGTGSLGGALAVSLHAKGYKIISLIDINGTKALQISKHVKCEKVGVTVSDLPSTSDIVFITVSDNQLGEIAVEISKLKHLYLKKMTFIHCSGVYTSDILEPLRKKGAITGSMHPIQTFPPNLNPAKLKTKFRGIYFGIDGIEESIRLMEQIIKMLGGKAIVIKKEIKPLYHIACVFASNYEMIFLNAVDELTRKIDIPVSWMEAFGPLITESMQNMIKHGIGKSLTGPIVRGDMKTVDIHLDSLSKFAPFLLPLYTIGGIEAARVAKENGRISEEEFKEIIIKFRKFIQSTSFTKISKGKK